MAVVESAPRIRTQSAFVPLLVVVAFMGLPLAGLMLFAFAAKPVGLLPSEPAIAVAFGAALSLGFGLVHIILSRRVARSLGYLLRPLEVPRASQTVETMVAADHQRTAGAVLQALRALASSEPTRDGDGRRFSTTTKLRFSSWGERVEALVSPVDGERSLLVVTSRAVLPTNLLDNGGNLGNVARVLASVRETVDSGSAPSG